MTTIACAPFAWNRSNLIAAEREIADRIELRPARPVRRGCHLFDRDARSARDDHRRLRGRRAHVHADVAVGMQIALSGTRRDEDGHVERQPEHLSRRVERGNRGARPRDQIDPSEGFAVPPQRELVAVAVRHVVVVVLGHVGETDRLEIERGHHFVQAQHALVVLERTRIVLRAKKRRACQHPRQAQQRFSPRDAVPPTLLDRSHGPPVAGPKSRATYHGFVTFVPSWTFVSFATFGSFVTFEPMRRDSNVRRIPPAAHLC